MSKKVDSKKLSWEEIYSIKIIHEVWENLMGNDIPKTLYKYSNFDEEGHLFNMILEGNLWLSSARNFNDPYDTAITHNFDELHEQIAVDWARSAVERNMPNL